MSEFNFGTGRGKLTDRAEAKVLKIARKHGADFVNTRLPGDGWRYWFSAPNRGHPFDQAKADEVWSALEAAGLADGDGLSDACFPAR